MSVRRACRDALRAALAGLTAGLPLAVAEAAPPAGNAADVARCAVISAADERLACYDGLVCAGIEDVDKRLACYDAIANAKPVRAQTAAAGDAKAASFGVNQLPRAPAGPELIKALVSKVSEDRLGHDLVWLDNGQLWSCSERDVLVRAGDKVTIKRAALGSYLMLTPSRRSCHVQRVQ